MKYILLLLVFSCAPERAFEYRIELPKKVYKMGEKIKLYYTLANNSKRFIFFVGRNHENIVLDSNNQEVKNRYNRAPQIRFKKDRTLKKLNKSSLYKFDKSSESFCYYNYKLSEGKYKVYSTYNLVYTEKDKGVFMGNYNKGDWKRERLISNTLEFEVTGEVYQEEPYPWYKDIDGNYIYIEEIEKLYSEKAYEKIYKKLQELKSLYKGKEYYKAASDEIKAYTRGVYQKEPYKDVEGNYKTGLIERLYYSEEAYEKIYKKLQELKSLYKDKKEYYKAASDAIKAYKERDRKKRDKMSRDARKKRDKMLRDAMKEREQKK